MLEDKMMVHDMAPSHGVPFKGFLIGNLVRKIPFDGFLKGFLSRVPYKVVHRKEQMRMGHIEGL